MYKGSTNSEECALFCSQNIDAEWPYWKTIGATDEGLTHDFESEWPPSMVIGKHIWTLCLTHDMFTTLIQLLYSMVKYGNTAGMCIWSYIGPMTFDLCLWLISRSMWSWSFWTFFAFCCSYDTLQRINVGWSYSHHRKIPWRHSHILTQEIGGGGGSNLKCFLKNDAT